MTTKYLFIFKAFKDSHVKTGFVTNSRRYENVVTTFFFTRNSVLSWRCWRIWSDSWCSSLLVSPSLQSQNPTANLAYACLLHSRTGNYMEWSQRVFKDVLILISRFQNTLYDWVRDHRVHHKYSETDADPHNSNRGFFFAHVGWLMLLKHPQVLKKGRAIDMSDVLADPVIQFHQKWVTT